MSVRKRRIEPVASSSFSEFIRNASVEEKERVYMEVMRKAIERQNRSLSGTAKEPTRKPRG